MGYIYTSFYIVLQYLLINSILAHKHHDDTHLITDKVSFKISSDGENIGEFTLGLYGKDVPKTVKNFLAFCKGTKIDGVNYSYKNSVFHRIIPNFMIQGGDIVNGNGTGSISIYGGKFADENFNVSHRPFVIAMANSGPDTNGSQFYVTTTQTPWLNGRHVVFGEVVANKEVVQKIESYGTPSGNPKKRTIITEVIIH